MAATLEGVSIPPNTVFTPSEESKKRIHELGLGALLNTEIVGQKSFEILDATLWKMASNVKKRRFGYGKEDFIASLKFLEVFCLYSGQTNLSSQRNQKVLEENVDTTVMKAIKQIEYINKLADSDIKKSNKIVLNQHIERLNHLINKIFTSNLSQTEQVAMGKIVEQAKSILQKISE